MSAAVLTAPGRVRLDRVRRPDPGPGQVRIRLEGSGVCGSDLAQWRGAPWFSYPLPPGQPGHEGWGEVDALGSGVEAPAPGTRVATLAIGAYANYALDHASAVVPLPDSLADRPFPAEPLGCAMNVFRRSHVAPDDAVVVVGIGFLGALLTRLAVVAGARVMAVSRRRFARDVGKQAGAEVVAELDHGPAALEEWVRDWNSGRLADSVIEVTGTQSGLDAASRLPRVRGRLVIAGYHQGGPRTVDLQGWNWRGLDVINAHERDQAEYVRGMREAITAVETGRLDPWPLITHTFPLDLLDQALDMARSRPDGFLKAVVIHDG